MRRLPYPSDDALPRQARLDGIGMAASLVCAVHCALMPFLLALVPAALGAGLASDWAEWSLFGASAVLGFTCMHRGRRVHGRSVAVPVFGVGLALLALGRVSEDRGWGGGGVVVLVLGGLSVAAAHAVNRRLCRECAVCRAPVNASSPNLPLDDA